MSRFFLAAAAIFIFCNADIARAEAPSAMPAGIYKLDMRHTSIIFKISHLGFSRFTGRFDRAEGQIDYNPPAPAQSGLDVTIYPASIDTNDEELNETLKGGNWFDTIKYPRARFHVTDIKLTGDDAAKITGDFTLLGVTHPLTLDAVLVGAGKAAMLNTQVMGFSASGHFSRSDYGMDNMEPWVGDEVTLQIEAEFEKE